MISACQIASAARAPFIRDGKVAAFKEYMDTLHANEVLAGVR